MTRKILLSGFGALLLAFSLSAQADILLFDYGYNIDGSISEPFFGDPVPAGADESGFDDVSGLGDIILTITGAGAHTIVGFFDHDIDADDNTFFNENGTSAGALAAGQRAEIDEPGFSFGDIYDNFADGLLDNTNSLLPGNEDDVSMAMSWDFVLAAGETAEIMFSIARTAPTGIFWLGQNDPDSQISIFLSSTLEITGDTQVPAPGTLWLLGAGLLGLGLSRRKVS